METNIFEKNGVTFIAINFDDKFVVTLSTYGASIYEIDTIDRNGICENVVLSLSMEHYFRNDKYCGLTIGRVAGRIEKGILYLDKEYTVEPNEKGNLLHSGKDTLAYKFFDYKIDEKDDEVIVEFNIKVKDLEDSFPGDLDLTVRYIITLYNIKLEYDAVSSKDTYLNLTNHSYFNMSGDLKSSILNQELMINKEKRSVVRSDLIFLGVNDVEREFDFRTPHKIGDYIESEIVQDGARGYDHMFTGENPVHLTLKDEESGRILTITSSYKDLVIYTNNYPTNTIYNDGMVDPRYYGIAIEPSRLSLSMIKGGYRVPKNTHYKEFINYSFTVEE